MVKISIIVVSYNRKDDLVICLNSLENLVYENYEIIVVDNASTDGTYEWLECLKWENLKLIRESENIGVMRAKNIGIKASIGEILVFLDNDCEIKDSLILNRILDKFRKNSRLGILYMRPVVPGLSNKGYKKYITHRRKSIFWGDDDHVVWSFVGSCFAAKKQVFEAVGLFDESLSPSHFEETEFAFRLSRSRFLVQYSPSIKVFHYESPNRPKEKYFYQSVLNRTVVSIRYIPLPFLITHLCGWFIIHVWRGMQMGYIAQMVRAYKKVWQEKKTIVKVRAHERLRLRDYIELWRRGNRLFY